MTVEEKKNIKIELKSRKIVVKKLESAIKSLRKITDRQKAEREERKQHLSEYKNERDLQDAYGWGFIEEEEYDRLRKAMQDGIEIIDSEKTAEEIALEIISGWRKLMNSDISDLEFQLLPAKEQDRIREQNYQIILKRLARNQQKKGVRSDDI